MTDWTKETGNNGQLMIRDTGSNVEFWFKAGFSSDWYNGLKFSWTANGGTTNKSINYPEGADWYHVGTVSISTDQTVTFRLVSDTSIGGIGGPTSFSHAIERSERPNAPTTPKLSNIGSTTITASFTDGPNNGAAIDSRQLGYSATTTVDGGSIIASDGSTTVSGLVSGRKYYFWARTHNAKGYSNWSGRGYATTLKVPDAPTTPLLASITSTTVDISWSGNGNGGSAITAYQIGYGTSSTTPSTIITATSPRVVTGLQPGVFYYFWVRAKNAVGYSPWSGYVSHRTIAGAYVKVGTTWKLAVPYVKVAGVWKIAEPWVRYVGEWKRTTN
jgi:hypothetical protein